MRKLITIAAAAVALAACQTMSPQECAVADWRALGYQDGVAGAGLDRFSDRQRTCAEAGFAADFERYRSGRDEGLDQYCRPDNGFRLGLSGSGYGGVCPAYADGEFRFAYDLGRRAYTVTSALNAAQSALNTLRAERQEVERKINANEAGLLAAATDEERRRHREELIRLREERLRIDGSVRERETELRLRNDELARARSDIGLRYGSW